jgi:fructose-bisphosphate aldolase class I
MENKMNTEILKSTIKALLANGKGILAADETPANIGKKFAALHIENTPKNRQKYREMLFTSPGIENYISGVIMQDETIHQSLNQGNLFSSFLKTKSILTGIKVDQGLEPLNGDLIETVTKGLEGLGDRLEEYKKYSATFAKWRSVIHIDAKAEKPTEEAVKVNSEGLAEYAYICQKHGIVPIVEPEVLMDGDHTIETSFNITSMVLKYLFDALKRKGVDIRNILLKPNMVIPGLLCADQKTPEIVFLSGGQRDELSIQHLALMNQSKDLSWVLSFSYGRALQRQALTSWKGEEINVPKAQQAFIEQARLNSLATLGQVV